MVIKSENGEWNFEIFWHFFFSLLVGRPINSNMHSVCSNSNRRVQPLFYKLFIFEFVYSTITFLSYFFIREKNSSNWKRKISLSARDEPDLKSFFHISNSFEFKWKLFPALWSLSRENFQTFRVRSQVKWAEFSWYTTSSLKCWTFLKLRWCSIIFLKIFAYASKGCWELIQKYWRRRHGYFNFHTPKFIFSSSSPIFIFDVK